MRLSKETIDKVKNTCYAEDRGELKVSFIYPPEELNRIRLTKALSLILSEKDVADYFRSSVDSFCPTIKKLSNGGNSGSLVA